MDFNDKLQETGVNPFGLLKIKFNVYTIFKWITDYRTRKAINIPFWLRKQVDEKNALDTLVEQKKWAGKDPDESVIEILRFVKAHLRYTGDLTTWNTMEYWQTAMETYKSRLGDCEDGAILLYVLARKSGISEEKILLTCGEVDDGRVKGGHAWIMYRPSLMMYPLDWCFHPDTRSLGKRKVLIVGSSHYKKVWFMVNEKEALGELR